MQMRRTFLFFISILTFSTIASVIRHSDLATTRLDADNVRIDGNTISTLNSNGNLLISPNGTGRLEYTPGIANTVPYLDSNKRLVSSAVTPTMLSFVDFTSSGQAQLDGKVEKSVLTTKGDIFVASASSTIVRQGIGSDGQVLTADSAQTNGLKWATPGAAAATPYFNYLVNGEFRHFQGTTPGTLTTIGDGGYGSDQWYHIDSNAGSASQIARVDGSSTAVGGQYLQFYAQFRQVNGTATQIGVCQPLENRRTVPLRGKQATFAFYAKTDGTEVTALRACVGEWTGTADTITKDVVSTWGATPTWITNFACKNTPADLTISSSWAQQSITATFGTTVNNAILCIWTPNAEAQNDDFYLSQMQLVEGASPLSWAVIQKPYDQDLAEVQRFAWKSFPVDTAPAQNAGVTGAFYTRYNGSSNMSSSWTTPVQMFKAPSITTYNPSAANSSARQVDVAADVAFVDVLSTPWAITFAFNTGSISIYRWHVFADARL